MTSPPARETLLFSALAIKTPLTELLPAFERGTGYRVRAAFEPTAILERLIAEGERPDVLICTGAAMSRLVEQGIVEGASARRFISSAIGVAVAPGYVHPSLGDIDSVTETLLGARSVAYSRSGASGQYFVRLVDRLGIAEEVNGRATILEKGFVGEALLDGRADLAIQQISELAAVVGIEIVGPFPDPLQEPVELSIGRSAQAGPGTGGEALLRFITSPEAMATFAAVGVEPVTDVRI